MDSNKISPSFGWKIPQLKKELVKRGATLSGRKENLLARLEACDRNKDFKGEPILLPEPLDPDWPDSGFHQLQMEHRMLLPKVFKEQIDGYFKYRMAIDNQSVSDLKAIYKGKKMHESDKIHACSVNVQTPFIFFSGIVGAAMNKTETYSYKLKLKIDNGEVQNSHYECPIGMGPHGTCKHIAAVLLMLLDYTNGNDPKVKRSCTEILQTFHKPKRQHVATPMKCEDMTSSKRCKLDDPRPASFRPRPASFRPRPASFRSRPASFRATPGYEDHVRNTVLNYCAMTSHELPIRYLYGEANTQAKRHDHDYLVGAMC